MAIGNEQILRWNERGLNIFASIPCSQLTQDLKSHIPFKATGSLVVLGSGGPSFWKNFPTPLNPQLHPLDSFCRDQILQWGKYGLQEDLSQKILFPRYDLHFPLQQLGRFLNLCAPSPLGIDISQEYGLWFAFRGVFITEKTLPVKMNESFKSPCEGCRDRHCLNFADDFIKARLSCPIKQEERYSVKQLAYHQSVLDERLIPNI